MTTDLLPCEQDDDEQYDAPLGDPLCPFRGHPLHVCSRRDGRVINSANDGACWKFARLQVLNGPKAKAG